MALLLEKRGLQFNCKMRHITIAILLTLSLVDAFGQEMTKEQQKLVLDFIDCVKTRQKEKLISKISFPFNREYPIPSIKSEKEFLERYSELFDDSLTKMITNSLPARDWSAVG